eukprot:XP_011673201.1 PREDICTED: uncharacterized protein LOC105442612 [Strongylocentrotus purpuratus]
MLQMWIEQCGQLAYSKLDLENLEIQVKEWAQQYPEDNFKLTLPSTAPVGDIDDPIPQEDDEEVVPNPRESGASHFFFCHQTRFQRHLLQRYGNKLCLLDATYRTTKYAVPLFFLAVKTNHGYSVVGDFVVQYETARAIQLGLQTIKQWMEEDGKDWNPSYFMTDFSEREIKAIEETFPECTTFLCDFHREQAWLRWLSKTENGVTSCKQKVLGMMRRCAHATQPAEYQAALGAFESSPEWRSSSKLRNWFSKQWYPHFKRWVWAYRADRDLQVNTNNGIERQNKIFKYDYLEQKKDLGISGMVSALITEYLPTMKLRYIQKNVSSMESLGRTYDEGIPSYLRSRKMEYALTVCKEDVIKISGSHFQVKSETSLPGCCYNVHINSAQNIPSCECWAWRWFRLPCKHMFAIFHLGEASWQDLPEEYRESPLFTLDSHVSGFLPERSGVSSIDETLEFDEGEVSHVDLPVSRQLSSKKAVALQVREHLEVLRDLSYVCNDVQILTSMEDKLGLLVATTHLRMQNEAGLVDAPVAPRGKKKRKRQKHSSGRHDTVLPQRKKRKSVRVGTAADRKRGNSRLITDYLAQAAQELQFTPSTSAPDVSAPAASASAPGASAPDASAPDTSAPAASAPDTSAPVASAPDASAPDASAPAASAPAASAPAASAPDASAPATSAPAASAPDASAPAASAPDASAPATSAPDASAPATSAPDASAPATSH